MIDLTDWLTGLAQDTLTISALAVLAVLALGIVAAITITGENIWWWFHDRYAKYGIRRPAPPARD